MYNYTLYCRVYKDRGENIMIEVEMTSLEIAELTGKKHKHINETIRNKMLPMLEIGRDFDPSIFKVESTTYVDSSNRNQNTFKLNRYAANALTSYYDLSFACKLVIKLDCMEKEAVEQQRQLDLMKDIVWKVIKDKSYLGRMYALQSAGVKHPRLFLRYLQENGKFHTDVHDRGLLKHQHVSPNTLVEMFTRKGFEWLLANKSNLDTWVEKQKVLEKQRKVLPC